MTFDDLPEREQPPPEPGGPDEEVGDGLGPAPDVPEEFAERPAAAEGAGPIPGHPNLEPEPPDREAPDEGIVSVEPVPDENDAGAEPPTERA